MQPDFFQAIEERLVRLRGAPLILSPSDWHLAASWWEQRIPLAVILRALDSIFERAARTRRGPIQSLSYCRHVVEQEYSRHLELSVGEPAPGRAPRQGEASSLERLRGKAARLEAIARASDGKTRSALQMASRELQETMASMETGTMEPARVEEELLRLEDRVTQALFDGLVPEERKELETACARRLAPYQGDMTAEVRAITRRRCLQREIRRRCHLPRLSLLAD